MLQETLDLNSILREYDEETLLTESSCGRIPHLYEDYRMTFNEMRQILRDIFQGKTVLTENIDGLNVLVTYKDGGLKFARNKTTMRDPMDIERMKGCFDAADGSLREAYENSVRDISRALNSIDGENLKRIFNDGQSFANITIVYPPCRNVMDYGNRCILQLNGVDNYDSNFNLISRDEDATKWLYGVLKSHKALSQEMFEIERPRMLRMRDSVSADKALEDLMKDFDSVIDGFSTKTTLRDYANERMRRYVINACNHNNIEVDRDCPFVREMADRLGYFSGRRPTKSDICTFAKRAGINVRSDDYRNLMGELEERRETVNEEVMRPVENLVMKAGVYLLKNLRGYMASDPQKCSQRLCEELSRVICEVEADNSKLTPQKLKLYRRHMRKLENWKDKVCPTEGVYFKFNGKTYKVNGAFGNIRQILKLFGGH